jgi:hypothetical protein
MYKKSHGRHEDDTITVPLIHVGPSVISDNTPIHACCATCSAIRIDDVARRVDSSCLTSCCGASSSNVRSLARARADLRRASIRHLTTHCCASSGVSERRPLVAIASHWKTSTPVASPDHSKVIIHSILQQALKTLKMQVFRAHSSRRRAARRKVRALLRPPRRALSRHATDSGNRADRHRLIDARRRGASRRVLF